MPFFRDGGKFSGTVQSAGKILGRDAQGTEITGKMHMPPVTLNCSWASFSDQKIRIAVVGCGAMQTARRLRNADAAFRSIQAHCILLEDCSRESVEL